MNTAAKLAQLFDDTALSPRLAELAAASEAVWHKGHGDLPRWRAAVDELPELQARDTDLSASPIRIGATGEVDEALQSDIESGLQTLHPWRKGPFSVFGIHIDSEWRSDWKWRRLQHHIQPLRGRHVLDVGCGNGYYMLRMLGEGASAVLGLEPMLIYNLQFQALCRFLPELPATMLPLPFEALDPAPAFDTVFSMGVLYHRRDPLEHLAGLLACLKPGGELVLETLVVEGDHNSVMLPPERYARMRNVWFLPSVAALENWLDRLGFVHIQCADVNVTSTEEQRSTAWMQFESLAQSLDPEDHTLTTEGLPAPRRALMVARRPD